MWTPFKDEQTRFGRRNFAKEPNLRSRRTTDRVQPSIRDYAIDVPSVPLVSNLSLTKAAATNPAPQLVHATTTRQSLTGSGGDPVAETAMVTYSLPASSLGANGGLRIIVWGTTAGASGNKTTRIRWSGVGGTQVAIATVAAGVNPVTRLEAYIFNRNATNSQFLGGMGIDTTAIDTVGGTTAAVDTTAAVSLVVSGRLADGADTVHVDQVLIERFSNAGGKFNLLFAVPQDRADWSEAKVWMKGYQGNANFAYLTSGKVSPIVFDLPPTGETLTFAVQSELLDGSVSELERSPTVAIVNS